MEVVESEEMQDDGEFQSQNIPRPFSNHKGVVGRGLFFVAVAEECGGFAEDGRTVIVFWSIFSAERKYSDALP